MNFFLFCKSYAGDLSRVISLWKSIQCFNRDAIPFYLCVPKKDLKLFQSNLENKSNDIHWIVDEDVVLSNPSLTLDLYHKWDGRLSQQVIKSEFWRYLEKNGVSHSYSSYLCIDSESQFIKDFYLSDFLDGNCNPYTVIHQNKELLQLADNKKIDKVSRHYLDDSKALKKIFQRVGPDYDFGPTPVIWSSKVWKDLEINYLKPNGMTIWDAIELYPSELRWYGEALLAYKSIELHPLEPIFRVYHYDWQYFFLKRVGESADSICKNYFGILKQSNWEYEMDYGEHAKRKSFASRQLKNLKRLLAQFR
jgi:hypothetical protein